MIGARLAQIREETDRVERALAHLAGSGDLRTPPARTPKKHDVPSGGGSGRAFRGRRREKLLAAVRANLGARPPELAEMIGIRATQASVLIAKARADRLIVKEGEGYVLK